VEIALAALVTLVTALAVHVAFSPAAAGRPTLFLALGVPYAPFAALAIRRLRRAEAASADAPAGPASGPTMRRVSLGLRSGDLTFGFAFALVLAEQRRPARVAALARAAISAPGRPRGVEPR
jgi:hypothetical protein